MATTSIASAFRSFTSRSPFRLLTQTPLPQAILRSPVAPSFRVESLTQFCSRSSTSSSFTRPKGRPLTRLTWSKGKSAGRNSAGRITSFHRGGGAKRLRRIVDLKRSTSAEGIVERIEYDPNRSARIALVRWTKGVYPPRQSKCSAIQESVQVVEPITATISSQFSFSSLPGKVNQRKVARASRGRTADSVMIGRPTRMSPRLKSRGNVKTCARDVFLSALYSPKDKGETALRSFGSSLSLPRIAVAGAKPAFFVPGRRDKLGGKNMFSLSEVQKWRSFLPTNRSLFVGAAEHDESKPKTNQGL